MDPGRLVEMYLEIVLDRIWEQLLCLIYYHRNIEQLNEQLVELTVKRISIKHQIDEATNIADQEIDEKVVHWLGKVDEISEQVQKLHQESQGKRECSITSCPNPWLRYKLSKRARAMARQVVDICGEGSFDRLSYLVPPQFMPELTDGESNEGIDSRVPIMNQIMEALRNPSVNMIGLCGVGGVGKTTIAKEVAKNHKMFEKVIMATVSAELNIKKIQGQIAQKLGMQLNERSKDARASRLRDRLKQEKNMLLILDDLWEELDLGRVGIPFADVENNSKKNEGCKILLTSRDDTLLSNCMKCQRIIKVGVLSENEAWELFKRIAELSVDSSSSELIHIATEIFRKCGGLPLAIATAAKALKNKALDEWKYALLQLNNPLRRNITGIKEVDSILKLSYDRLSSSEYKHIFLLAAMLSHDPSIEELLMYSVGLNILQNIENMEDACLGISRIVSNLKALNLFLDSFSSHHVTMHDVFRDFALSMASDEFHAFIVRHRTVKEWPDEIMPEDCKGICLQESDITVDLPKELHGPHLQFFMLNSTKHDLAIPCMFFKSSKELKVLSFTNVRFLRLPSLYSLRKLRTLCLHSCFLEDITEIRSLKNLKILSLAYSEIQWLPIELAELTSLQMLNLSHCSKLEVIPPKILSSLKKLEVLYMGNSFNKWKVEGASEVNENASLEELKDLPISSIDIHIPNVSMLPEDLFLDMNLKRYRIIIGKFWKWQGNYGNSLKLELESSIHLKPWVQKLLEGVEDLSLYCATVSNEVFKSLFNGKKLTLEGKEAEMIGSHQFSMYHFPKVQMLYLRIEEATTISYASLLRSFPNLERLHLRGDFEETFGGDDVATIAPRLSTFTLEHVSNMINLAPTLVSSPKLTHLQVRSCYKLTILMTSSAARRLVHLTHLSISCCNQIEEIITKHEGEDDDDQEIVFNKLMSLEFYELPSLKRFCGHNYTFKFPSLDQLTITRCPKFKAFSPGTIDAPSLKRVHLSQSEIWVTNPNQTFSRQQFVVSKKLMLNENDESMIRNDQFPKNPSRQLEIPSCDKAQGEILPIERIVDEGVTVPYTFLQRFPQVNELHVQDSSFLEIFPSQAHIVDRTAEIPAFTKLYLANLDQLKNIWGDDSQQSSIQNLEILHVQNCSNLIKLAPSSASFDNLTELKVSKCHQLVYLVTNSTTKSLMSLEILEINDCKQMEELVKKESIEDVEGGITFNKMRMLKLTHLPRLKTLDKRDFNIEDRATNTGCTNVFRSLFGHNKVLLPKLERLEFSSLNSLIPMIWDDQLWHNSFSNLKTLIVKDCGLVKLVPLHVLKSLNNLEELEVRHCEMLEMVFDLEDLNGSNDMVSSLKVVPLKKLQLWGLPKLKNVWNNDPEGIFSFQSLRSVHVSDCESLTSMFPASIAKSMLRLEELCISKCGINAIVAKDQVSASVTAPFEFPRLTSLNLSGLPNLRSIF